MVVENTCEVKMNIISRVIRAMRAENEMRISRPYSDYAYPDPNEIMHRMERPEYGYIMDWIKPKSKVLDLGCGDGSLGELLIKNKKIAIVDADIRPS